MKRSRTADHPVVVTVPVERSTEETGTIAVYISVGLFVRHAHVESFTILVDVLVTEPSFSTVAADRLVGAIAALPALWTSLRLEHWTIAGSSRQLLQSL